MGFHIPKPRPVSSGSEVIPEEPLETVLPDEEDSHLGNLERLALSESKNSDDAGSSSGEEEDDDVTEEDSDWITPDNLDDALLKMGGDTRRVDESNDHVIVACLTTDFAMQVG